MHFANGYFDLMRYTVCYTWVFPIVGKHRLLVYFSVNFVAYKCVEYLHIILSLDANYIETFTFSSRNEWNLSTDDSINILIFHQNFHHTFMCDINFIEILIQENKFWRERIPEINRISNCLWCAFKRYSNILPILMTVCQYKCIYDFCFWILSETFYSN